MKKIITAPEEIITTSTVPVIFLAGTIDEGKSKNWQTETAEILQNKYTVLNPRRPEWPELSEKELEKQINWEMNGLNRANFILLNFEENSKSPITFLELGLFAKSKKMYVVVNENFYRYINVKFICNLYNIPMYKNLSDVINLLLK